jgi:glucokinase
MTNYPIGIDLGGTNLRLVAYSHAEGILDRVDLRTNLEGGPEAVVEDIRRSVFKLDATHSSRELVGIGMGTPGPLELPTGVLHGPPNLPGWDNFNLLSALRNALDRDVHLDSDANLAALAEFALGAGTTHVTESLFMFSIGTGVGGAIILSGKIHGGAHGMAGEAGHGSVWADGPLCTCGSRGCLELYASATAVRRMAEEAIATGRAPRLAAVKQRQGFVDSRSVCTLGLAGDPASLAIFDKVGEALGITLSTLVNTLDLPLYLIGGGLAQAWPLFAPRMFEELEMRSYVYRLVNRRLKNKITIARAGLGTDSGLLGAALLPYPAGSPLQIPAAAALIAD